MGAGRSTGTELNKATLDAMVARIPAYRQRPAEELASDISWVITTT